MTLQEFITRYDYIGSIVLLEGKRDVAEADKEKLIKLGRLLASTTKNVSFRSGNADGADFYFISGVAEIDKTRTCVIVPYANHRNKFNYAGTTIELEKINLKKEQKLIDESKLNKRMSELIEMYVAGDINKNSIKAAYILRDTIKVLGTSDIPPATFGIFYDDLRNPMKGGTGHTMQVCINNNVPYVNQSTWFDWL
jgi:hypothetical protein